MRSTAIRRWWPGVLFTGRVGMIGGACGSDEESVRRDETAGIGGDADAGDVQPDAGADAALDSDAGADASSTPCAPPCGSTQVCCVDEHGHFPRCVDAETCPAPLQPADVD